MRISRLQKVRRSVQRRLSESAGASTIDDEYKSVGTNVMVTRVRPQPRLEALREQLRKDEPTGGILSSAGTHPRAFAARIETLPAIPGNNNRMLGVPCVQPRTAPVTLKDWRNVLKGLPDPPTAEEILQDSFGRRHNYLRLSVTERCNFRCTYCMPAEGVPLQPANYLLTTQELLTLAGYFSRAGVDKFRLTGGEPTLRKDIVEIVRGLKQMKSSSKVGITTNGFLLGQKPTLLAELVEAGLDSINLSLDSLNADKFARITRRPETYLPKVCQVLDQAASFVPQLAIKVNVVVMRGQNDDELEDFVRLGNEKNVIIRFIEYMPFTENGWNTGTFMSYQEMMNQTRFIWDKLEDLDPHDTTKWYAAKSPDGAQLSTVGFISSMSHHFCAGCNRLRISADGQIKVCLFDSGSNMVSLRDALRAGLTRDELYRVVYAAVQSKPFALGGHADAVGIQEDSMNNRPMTLIGG